MSALTWLINVLTTGVYGGSWTFACESPALRTLLMGAPSIVAWLLMAVLAFAALPRRRALLVGLAFGAGLLRVAVELWGPVLANELAVDPGHLVLIATTLASSALHAAQWGLTVWAAFDPLTARAGVLARLEGYSWT